MSGSGCYTATELGDEHFFRWLLESKLLSVFCQKLSKSLDANLWILSLEEV